MKISRVAGEIFWSELILQGMQGERGWTLVIAEDTGQMSAAISGAVQGYIIFGSCT